ncbi:MAG: ABC transporter ATP-binding protein [Chloroflexi bacterium]|nr:ABC transporter ATP-binding protein [Chloroflexota bacterium]
MPPDGTQPLLQVRDLTKHFLGVTALQDVSFDLYRGELLSLIGPNGSGKTTLFNCVSGFLKIDKGQVRFRGEDISNMRPDRIALKGMRRTFQDVRIFQDMTVLENLMTAVQQHQEENLIERLLGTQRIQNFEAAARERSYELLRRVDMLPWQYTQARHLSYGQRKLLEFATALMPDPELILLDEPAAGVSGEMVDRMKQHMLDLHAQGKTILVVEHNMRVVMDVSERIVVLDYGQKIAEGTPAEVQNNAQVREAYFGH